MKVLERRSKPEKLPSNVNCATTTECDSRELSVQEIIDEYDRKHCPHDQYVHDHWDRFKDRIK